MKFTRDDVPGIQEKNELKEAELQQKALEQQIDKFFFFFKCSRTDGRNSSAEIIEKGDQPNDVHKRSLEIEKQVGSPSIQTNHRWCEKNGEDSVWRGLFF